jgi:uncharacterized protein (TIGR03437 family)
MFGLAIAAAQTLDSTGNALLKGTFHFRHVAIQNVDANSNPSEVTAAYGTITFDGAGKYTATGIFIDNKAVLAGALNSQSGTYVIGANGTGYITNELYPNDPNAVIYGAVAQGVFTGSSTESEQDSNVLNDLFVAIPAGTAPTNASFTTSYQTGLLDFTGGASTAIRNALFQLTPDGKGGFAAFNMTGQTSNLSGAQTQAVTGATYNFNSDGSATLTIPPATGIASANVLFTGTKTIFQSADGNFILGWTSTGYDIFFGVKALAVPATNAVTTGLYFTAAVEDATGGGGADSYAGSTLSSGDTNGDSVVHQRLNSALTYAIDYGTDDQIVLNANGSTTTDTNGYQYLFGAGGQAFVGIGTGGFFSLQIGLHAPAFAGSGVYLNPIGVVNAASWQPITASLAPGELFVLFGTGLAKSTLSTPSGQPFATSLGGVSVTIDGIACPVFYVSPTQIAAVAPFALASNQSDLANIQVTSNGVQSNVVQMYLTDAAPGSFAQTAGGFGYAAALHAASGQEITPSNPALPGEFISLYVTGLGTVTPAVADGAVGPSSPTSWSTLFKSGNLQVFFNDYGIGGTTGIPGNIQFAGLAPTLAGLYQINVEVPSIGLSNGDTVYVEFATDAADINEVSIPYGSAPTPAFRASTASPARNARPHGLRMRSSGTMRTPPRGRGPAVVAAAGS